MDNQPILDAIDPEYIDRLAARQQEIDRGSWTRPGIALHGRGQSSLPAAVKGVLDYALALEIFEDEFYKAVLGTSANQGTNAAFASVRTQAMAVPGAVATLTQIEKHEAAHRATLLATGATNVFGLDQNSFDFTGARGAGNGPFAKATINLAFLLEVAQGAEDTGVRAYKGQAGILLANSQPAILEAALRIHSVEARHASRIRRMRRIAAGAGATVRYSGTVRGGGAAAAGATDAGDTAAGAGGSVRAGSGTGVGCAAGPAAQAIALASRKDEASGATRTRAAGLNGGRRILQPRPRWAPASIGQRRERAARKGRPFVACPTGIRKSSG
jgi:hypothetical protein